MDASKPLEVVDIPSHSNGEGESKVINDEKVTELDKQPPIDGADYVSPKPESTLSLARKIALSCLMTSTTFLASMTISSSLMLIPSMSEDLRASELAVQWVSSAYSLAVGCGLLVSGRLADLYGRKRLWSLGLALYAAWSLASGFVRHRIAVCVLRSLAGLGMSLALPASFGIIGTSFPLEPGRTIAFACLGLGYPVGSGPGMVVSRVVAGMSGRAWQYVFIVLGGLAVIPLVLGWWIIPPDSGALAKGEEAVDRRLDWAGGLLITSAFGLFGFSITQAGLIADGWKQPYIPALLTFSILLMVVFVWWQHHLVLTGGRPPLVDPRILQKRGYKVASVLAIVFTAYNAIGGWVYLTSIWFQRLKGESPLLNALHVLPAPIVGMLANFLVPVLAPRVRAPVLLVFGGLSTSIACLLFAVAPPRMTYWACEFLSNVFNPFGADFTVGIGSVLISNLVEANEQSLAGALFQTSIQIAGTTGVTLSSLVQSTVEQTTGDLRKALRVAFWMLAGFAWASAVIATVTLRRVGVVKDVRRAT